VTLTPQRIEIIKTELEHLRRLVGDLTTLSQVEAGGLEMQLEPVIPAALLERVFRAFQPIAARQGVALALRVDDSVPAICVDEGRTEQVIMNLLENALRYTPGGGKIELGAQVADLVQLWVRDSGSGIDPEDLPYIFDRFYRADKARGTNAGKMGLGLSISKALVDAQGGSIKAESAGIGQGTTMILEFQRFENQ
jgi:signal transduction histidine kinase